jgi:hypothetical protein
MNCGAVELRRRLAMGEVTLRRASDRLMRGETSLLVFETIANDAIVLEWL